MKTILHSLCLVFFLSFSNAWSAEKMSVEVQKTYKDIEKTLGMVPTFLKEFPAEVLPGAWFDMKSLEINPETALSGRDKELIGLGVAAQIPCRYCVYFHSETAKLNKASAQELKEAIAMAAGTQRWSTFLQGTQTDLAVFKGEADRMLEFMSQKKNVQAMEEPPQKMKAEIMTADEAYKDMELSFGFVPTFVKNYPQDSIVGIWKEFKALQMSPDTALSGKTKNLIGVAVAAQIPCPHCVYFTTKSAMLHGATQEEVNEAIAMAGITRHWSTVLNGQHTDEKKFMAETDKVIKFVKSKMSKEVTLK